MLKNTFIHIPKVSRDFENDLWENDVLNWDEFLKKKDALGISDSKKELITNHLKNSKQACADKNHQFFVKHMPSSLHWRAYPEFKENTCFLDIETTGLSREFSDITVIGVHDGKDTKLFVKGKNLEDFKEEIKKYSTIVTFNGRCFDVPFIKAKYPELDLDKLHIDLRYALKELGYSGGLKRIEKELGITRSDELEGVDGFEAVRLWYRYLKGDEKALQTLLDYNKADVENLKVMMDFAYQKLKEKNFLSKIN